MELRAPVVGIVVAMAVVTLLPRLLPFIALKRVSPPPWLREWLTQVPLAVLAALAILALAAPDRGAVGGMGVVVVAMVPVAVVAAWRGSFLLSVLVGVAGVALLRLVGG